MLRIESWPTNDKMIPIEEIERMLAELGEELAKELKEASEE